MGFCAKIVPLTCKTTIMNPNGSILAVLQVEGRFFRLFLAKTYNFWYLALKFAKSWRKTVPQLCKTAIVDPLGSIIVVLQVRGTFLAQNPIKLANRKNRPGVITALPSTLKLFSGFPKYWKRLLCFRKHKYQYKNSQYTRNDDQPRCNTYAD